MTTSHPTQVREAAALRAAGLALFNARKFPDAARAYQQSLALEPAHFDAHLMLGTIASLCAAPESAAAHYGAAIAADPGNAIAHMNLGLARSAMRDMTGALEAFERAVALAPNLAEAHCNRGVALERLARLDEALAAYELAIALEPAHVRAHSNRGSVLLALRRPAESLASYDSAIALDPGSSRSYSKRGVALMELKRPADALQSFARAIVLDRGNAEAYWNAALCHLLCGRLDEGFRLYEWRKRLPEPIAVRALPAPLWTGLQPIAGRSIYVYAEQGLGDTLQFCRYALALRTAGAHVVLAVPRALQRLVATLGADVQVIGDDATPPATDFHIPLLSLPLAMRTQPATIPVPVPYLRADTDGVARWAARIGTHGFRVGVAWAGNATHLDLGRFFPLAALAPLAASPGVRLISLQKGRGIDQLACLPPGMSVETLGEQFDAGPDAFIDSAAVLQSLDLLITPDTALAHLAGALGRRAWVVLKEVPDWRWGLDTSDTPWYPTLQLYRQPQRNDWQGAIAAVRRALIDLACA